MGLYSPIFIKNYFLTRLLNTRLYFIKEKTRITDFLKGMQAVKKVLVILPRDRAEEIIARKFLSGIFKVFDHAQVSTLDIFNLRKIDVNWLGIPNHAYLNRTRGENFDLIIDLNTYHDVLCTYLTALVEAPMRLHLVEGKFDKIYNLHIRSAGESSIEKRYQNLVTYLSHFRPQSS